MSDETLNTTLTSMRNVAAQVHRCPACHSPHIYTAAHVTYIFDHIKGRMEAVSTVSLAENGWHGCFACDHQWISSPMIQTGMSPETLPAKSDKVIDLQTFKQGR